jgi:hypothetical protein
MSSPTIAILWKGPNGRFCVVRRLGDHFVLTLERQEVVEQEQIVTTLRQAIRLAAEWKERFRSN